jgi:hypothetical protein
MARFLDGLRGRNVIPMAGLCLVGAWRTPAALADLRR